MAQPLWRWPDLCAALSLPVSAGPDVTGISIDSRSIKPGDLFVALTGDPGPRFNPSQRSDRDGHNFIDMALASGAAGVVCHDGVSRSSPTLDVGDTLDALWAIGRAGRARLACPVLAITGSSGKTTTKDMLGAALEAFHTSGSLNNHLGVPLSLARTPADSAAAVYEIGTNHPGEIAPLAQLVQPDVAIVLNVHPAHAENFATLADLRTEKLSISAGLPEGGTLVVEDLIDAAEVPEHVRRLRFGATAAADIQLVTLHEQTAEYAIQGTPLAAHVPGGGRHRALSLAAVLGALTSIGADPLLACNLDNDLVPRGRGARLEAGGITLLDDSYNANPASMRAALVALAELPGRKFALLGEMLELGDDTAHYHRQLADCCHDLTGVFLVGEGMQALLQALPAKLPADYWPAPDESLLKALQQHLQPGDTLLIKGSNRVFWAQNFVTQLTTTLNNPQNDN